MDLAFWAVLVLVGLWLLGRKLERIHEDVLALHDPDEDDD